MKILLGTQDSSLAFLVEHALARFGYEWEQANNGFDVFQQAVTHRFDALMIDYKLPRMDAVEILRRFNSLKDFKHPVVIVFTNHERERLSIEKEHFQKVRVVSRPLAIRSFVETVQDMLHHHRRLTCLGGGTGLFTLLSGLKTISGVQLYSIVSMSDDGGSTGLLRDLFGILPPGDIRRSLVALSTAPDLLNELIQYRFQRGKGLEGHNLGNLLLTALSEMRGSMTEAIKALGDILSIQGSVIPVTESVNTLKAKLSDGSIVKGEHRIDLFEGRNPRTKIEQLWQVPSVKATPDALEAILNSEYILIGPGDLFTSIISNLIVDGIREAICLSRAKKIYICNVMTKPGETGGFTVEDHVREIVKYLGEDALDYVICSSTRFHQKALEVYEKKNQVPVIQKSAAKLAKMTRAKILLKDVASEKELVRHDSLKLAAVLEKIVNPSSIG